MHNIDINNFNIRTDLAIEEDIENNKIKENIYNGIKVTTCNLKSDNIYKKKKGTYITIEFDDVTDFNNSKEVEKILIKELKKMIKKLKITDEMTALVIGLGNKNSTPDSLGPFAIENVLVTNHFFSLGINVEKGFRRVCAFNPGVMGSTGLETSDIVNALTKEINPDFIIVVDALKASKVERLNKTIQITDAGINPGSGIGNNRKEISIEVLGKPVIAIGVPTVVDTVTIVNDTFNYIVNHYTYMKENINNPTEKLKIVRSNITNENVNLEDKKEILGLIGNLSEDDIKKLINEVLIQSSDNMIVTTKDIDFIIKRLSDVISTSINNVLHNNVTHL